MWARVVETMLGCWLALSPFVFRHPPDKTEWWLNDFACAVAIWLFSLASFWRPLHGAHLGVAAVGGWMIAFAYLTRADTTPPALQNNALVGLLMLMFALIPSDASRPPHAWRQIEDPEPN